MVATVATDSKLWLYWHKIGVVSIILYKKKYSVLVKWAWLIDELFLSFSQCVLQNGHAAK